MDSWPWVNSQSFQIPKIGGFQQQNFFQTDKNSNVNRQILGMRDPTWLSYLDLKKIELVAIQLYQCGGDSQKNLHALAAEK
jgi:hypothetical protein